MPSAALCPPDHRLRRPTSHPNRRSVSRTGFIGVSAQVHWNSADRHRWSNLGTYMPGMSDLKRKGSHVYHSSPGRP